jgi:3-oxoacyl-[acyl-carrier-protein] synthase-1/3-oxoacyl-[acyl-carrier-protein] synthase II
VSIAIVAFGAVSALGAGEGAASAGEVGEPARVAIARDEELAASGLARPFAARVALGGQEDATDRATRIFAASFEACARSLDASRPGWRAGRVGLAIGTSSGGMRTAQELFAGIARHEVLEASLAARAAYFGPLLDVVARNGLSFAPASLVLSACASSAVAIGLASRWLEAGECDVALAGGFDALSAFVGAGFEALRATSATTPPRPFRVGRDGMALGEGGAVVALVRAADAVKPLGYVRGFGASADAVHLTAPDRQGAGLLRAARAALAEAGAPRVDLVSAHATATPFNDAAEARALAEVAGDAVVHAFKAQAGHTLGAAGALESLVALDAMARGILPPTAGEGALDPEAPARLLARAERGNPRTALKLASAFGGANAALVLSADPGPIASPLCPRWPSSRRRSALPPTGSPASTGTRSGASRPSTRSRRGSGATRSPARASWSARPPRRSRRTRSSLRCFASAAGASSRRVSSRTRRPTPSRASAASPSSSRGLRSQSAPASRRGSRRSPWPPRSSAQGTRTAWSSSRWTTWPT